MSLYFHNVVLRVVFLFFVAAVVFMFLYITVNSTLALPKLEQQLTSTVNYYTYRHLYNQLASTSVGIEQSSGRDQVQSASYSSALSVPVLLYHGIIEKVDEDDNYSVTKTQFRDQLFALKEAGYRTITVNEYVEFVKGRKELPDKSFLLTFDDGRKDSYYEADPVLKALGFNAVMYVASDSFTSGESSYYLNKPELKAMIDSSRWEIQSHGFDAPHLIQIDEEGRKGHFLSNVMWLKNEKRFETKDEFSTRVLRDFVNWKSYLRDELGIESMTYAFPFGDYGQDTANFPGAKEIVLENAQNVFSIGFEQVRRGSGFTFNYQDPDK
jgi:poly-beta-1,6-N-acetyl-D-glucosamine N-deacetylase